MNLYMLNTLYVTNSINCIFILHYRIVQDILDSLYSRKLEKVHVSPYFHENMKIYSLNRFFTALIYLCTLILENALSTPRTLCDPPPHPTPSLNTYMQLTIICGITVSERFPQNHFRYRQYGHGCQPSDSDLFHLSMVCSLGLSCFCSISLVIGW